MKYIDQFHEGMRVSDVYLCKTKQILLTKNGKEYVSMTLQDRTGTIDSKIWDLGSPGIGNFDVMNYVYIDGELTALIQSMKNPWLKQLAESYFTDDKEFVKRFCFHSAAKSVHHGFVGGLLEHTLSVMKLCDYYSAAYPMINRDLLLTAALFHDVGKTKELSAFPENDYTDDGQLLGHIIIGTEMVGERIRTIAGFPEKTASELKHCILAHHGELEYGSPKKPALMEALALAFADNTDAKLETMTELLKKAGDNTQWLGFNRLLESNVRKTTV